MGLASTAMTFSDEERAELIAALALTADIVGLLLKQLDLLLDARDSGRVLTEAEAVQIRQHSAIWHQQLEKLRLRLTGLTIEPPTRVQWSAAGENVGAIDLSIEERCQ